MNTTDNPVSMTRQALQDEVERFGRDQAWNHNFELPDGVQTRPGVQISHGKNTVKLARFEPLFERMALHGMRVLDVGCNEGFFSLHMAGRGAEVLGIDVDPKRIAKARFVQRVLKTEQVRYEVMDIYSREFKALPRFDVCLCFGFLHRVPDPFTAIAALAEAADLILFEWKALKFGPHDEAFAYFSDKDIDQQDFYGTEYWLLSFAALERILHRLGFRNYYRIDDPRQRRAILVAGRDHHPLFDHPDQVFYRARFRTLLSHSKRFVKTLFAILSGRVNA